MKKLKEYFVFVTFKTRNSVTQDMKNNEAILNMHRSDQTVVVHNIKLKRPVTTLLCIRHASYWWTEPLHVKQRWGTVPRVHYHSRLTWHCFSKDWLPAPLQLEVNRQFSISREHGFISKSGGVVGVKREKWNQVQIVAPVRSEKKEQCRPLNGSSVLCSLQTHIQVVKWFREHANTTVNKENKS